MFNAAVSFLFLLFFGGYSVSTSPELMAARDAQRRSDVNVVLNAVWQYALDNNGALPKNIPLNTPAEICASQAPVKPCVDLKVLEGSYIVSLPRDPEAPEGHTWYTIVKSGENRVTVTAMHPESEEVISITR